MKVPLARQENIIARVARKPGSRIVVNDVASSSINRENPLIKKFQPTALFAFPLRVRGKVVGSWSATTGKAADKTLPRNGLPHQLLSNQIAIAIQKPLVSIGSWRVSTTIPRASSKTPTRGSG